MKNKNPWLITLVSVAVVGGIAGFFYARSKKNCSKGSCGKGSCDKD